MKNKEIEELLNRLKDNDDWYVIENKEEHNTEPYKLLLPTERNLLLSYIEQLQNNRDKAIEYLEKDLQISILPNNQIINGTEVVKRINKIEDILKGDGDE